MTTKRSLFKEENLVFHHLDQKANDFAGKSVAAIENGEGKNQAAEDHATMERQAELEAYRRRFEEAMIRIEDQEDVAAYRDARKEIDEEFDEQKICEVDPVTELPIVPVVEGASKPEDPQQEVSK